MCVIPAHQRAQKLLWTLLDLQEDFLNQVEEGHASSVPQAQASSNGGSDEEILSNDEEEEGEMGVKEEEASVLKLSVKSRKRKRIIDSERDCEAEVENLRSRLCPYRNAVIGKWNEKTRLASGKITSKVSLLCLHGGMLLAAQFLVQAYIEVDRSTLSQIDQVK